MGAQNNVAPVIIKRKKIIKGGGHHGGAWKVAYADFVTAMMAFFMLMWLLNATTEQQRKGLADYFAPTIAINRISGGGNGAFGCESICSERTLPKNGTGATDHHSSKEVAVRGDTGTSSDEGAKEAQDEAFKVVDQMLLGRGGESMVMENALEHIVTRITDEGVVIELDDLLAALTSQLGSGNMAKMANWIGMEARTTAPVQFDGSPITLNPNPAAASDEVFLVVYDSDGQEVQRNTIPVSADPIEWAGVSDDGTPFEAGLYQFNIESRANGELLLSEPAETYARITEARTQAGETVLVLDGGSAVLASSVSGLREAS